MAKPTDDLGAPGQGVATAFVTGGTTNVFNAFEGLTTATNQSGINPVGHGHITADAAQSNDHPPAVAASTDWAFG